MSYSVKGKIVDILDVEEGISKSGKGWQKCSFVIDTSEKFNPNIAFSVFGSDKVNELKSYSIGQDVEVSFNAYSREFQGKWYSSLDCWKISNLDSNAPKQNAVGVDENEVDDLPF